jgi:Flp pilus assembly protein TadG
MNRPESPKGVGRRIQPRLERVCFRKGHRRGSAVIEVAFCLPLLMLVMTGIFAFGVAISNYMILTNAVAIGGQAVAVSRGTTTGANPCNTAYLAVAGASPLLSPASMSFTLVLNGSSFSGTGSAFSCASGSADVIQSKTATLTATYPCSLGVYGKNLVPGCTLTSQIAEIIQ